MIGQARVKDLLRQAIASKRIAHAYLFVGPAGIGKDALALEFARVLNCTAGGTDACGECGSCRAMETLQHPEFHLVFPLPVGKGEEKGDNPLEKLTPEQIGEIREEIRLKAEDPYHRIEVAKATVIKINSIRDIKRVASLSTAAGGRKVFAVLQADNMQAEGANALLKTLEEPLGDTVLLLTATDRDALLPTIVSRCQTMACDLLQEDDVAAALVSRDGADPVIARLAAQMANGSYEVARSFLSEEVQEQRGQVVEFLRTILGRTRTDLAAFVDAIALPNDRPELERWLRLLGIWLHDALLFRERGTLPPTGDTDALKNFVARFPSADLLGALESVERSIAHLNRNAYLHLLLINLAVDLRRLITGRSQA